MPTSSQDLAPSSAERLDALDKKETEEVIQNRGRSPPLGLGRRVIMGDGSKGAEE